MQRPMLPACAPEPCRFGFLGRDPGVRDDAVVDAGILGLASAPPSP